MAHINFIHPEQVIKAAENKEKPFFEVTEKDYWLAFYDVTIPEGYELHENKETGEQLPYCCETHKRLFKETQDWFDKFPMDCEPHKKLLKEAWFNRDNYKDVATKVVLQFSFTTYHIMKYLEAPDWYKEITDYMEHIVYSFGQFPPGYGPSVGLDFYLTRLKKWLKQETINIPAEKKELLIKRIERFEDNSAPAVAGNSTRDMNILHATFQKWLKLFPFDIVYFSQLKELLSKALLFLTEPPIVNKYTGLAVMKMHTQASLIEGLHGLTIQLLKQVNTTELLEKDVISDKNKHAIELTNANHRLKQDTVLSKSTKGELKYVKVLKEWLANEKEYFNEITPLLNKVGEAPASTVEKEKEKINGKMDEAEDEAEIQRRRDFKFYIDETYNFSPTFEDFIEELAIQKKATDLGRMLLFLREAKKVYGNARHYYLIWGARGTHIDRGPLYDKIITLINILTNKLLNISIEDFQVITLTDLFEVNRPILNYAHLEKYFYPDKISVFKDIENEMVQRGILNSDGHWSSEYPKNDLVAFIGILKRVGIMKSKLHGTSEKRSIFHIRQLFEKRYHVSSLEQEMRPSRINKNRVDYKHLFPFIPGI